MFLSLLIIFIGLCFALIFINRRAETQINKFLGRNTTIADEKSLNEYKSVVRENMYLALALIGIMFASFCITAVFIWLKGILGALPLLLLLLLISALGSTKVRKLEVKARSLTCANRDLEHRYQKISKIWVKQALPNF
ncbi:MAG: hypothetical protein H0U45_14005 [Tatlockia sp.]|nr:hypothetical protein [Tatlockia sp.]